MEKVAVMPQDLVTIVLFVQARFPESYVVCNRSNKIDFYPQFSDDDIPVATIDLLSGKVIWLDEGVTFHSTYPAVLKPIGG